MIRKNTRSWGTVGYKGNGRSWGTVGYYKITKQIHAHNIIKLQYSPDVTLTLLRMHSTYLFINSYESEEEERI